MSLRWLALVCAVGASAPACKSSHDTTPDAPAAPVSTAHSASIAVGSDGLSVFVVNPDVDSVSFVDVASRTLTAEVLLAGAHPSLNGSGAYVPAVMPRALALSPDGTTLWVSGQRAGAVYPIDVASQQVGAPIAVGSEPAGLVISADGSSVYVATSQDYTVVRIDTASRAVTASVQLAAEPWALGWSSDGTLIATLFLGAQLVQIDPQAMIVKATWTIPNTAPRGDARLAHGLVRGLYDVAVRPTSSELWVAHLMLGTDTPQPALDFESTVFPSLSLVEASGAYEVTLSTNANDIPGINGSFGDVVSGPHSIAFTHDGAYAIVADSDSEDLLVVDANARSEASLLRPLPGHQPEGVAIAPDDSAVYVDERNTGDIAVVTIDHSSGLALAVAGPPIARYASDPMPAQMRLGQHIFFSANSDEYPVTQNHWVSCASCHLEGRTDAVTWDFAQGPRDTPSNAGGMLDTGFLFRAAARTEVQDYWHTINVEQGGSFDPTAQATLLDALEVFVDYAMPLPIPPTTDPTLVARGMQVFDDPTVGCASCHFGPRYTDSGTGSIAMTGMLDLTLPEAELPTHDGNALGTCVTTGYPDVASTDVLGDPRAACMFDTPTLSGIASSPPYLHDGSAPTLLDVLEKTRGMMGNITMLSTDDENALVEYLRSL
jgi:YVTN family beta-propeller protein